MVQKYFNTLSQKQTDQFAALKDLYSEWNQKINVISRKDMDEFYLHHVLHSLSIAKVFDFPAGHKVIDIGTGGGFPGIPLAIYFPEVQFHLVDSIAKKIKVVNEVVKEIGLTNVSSEHKRAEEVKQKFDVVVSRAVAPIKDLWKWSKPLLLSTVNRQPSTPHGLICLKGGDLSGEISESGLNPSVCKIEEIFREEFFREKYILLVSNS